MLICVHIHIYFDKKFTRLSGNAHASSEDKIPLYSKKEASMSLSNVEMMTVSEH